MTPRKSQKTGGGRPAIVQAPPAQLTDTSSVHYAELLSELKSQIAGARIKAALAVNRELILLYWSIGRRILERQQEEGWGAGVIERLSVDLRSAFPDMRGLSARNLGYMKRLAFAFPDQAILQQVVAKLPWGHFVRIIDRTQSPDEALWYIQKTTEQGWSRNVLVHQIESGLYERQGRAQSNFAATLPPPQSDLAQQLLKDPYHFEFLGMQEGLRERDLERSLIERLKDFMLELGVGFAFVGSQYHLQVGEQDYYLDLLFYHLQLRSFVILELKVGEFEPEYAGKMNFYLSAVDDLLRHPQDNPSIGLILCKSRNRIVVEYSLRDMSKPMGVAGYHLTAALPQALRGTLPTAEEIEQGLRGSQD